MTQDTTTGASVAAEKLLFDDWTDAIEERVRAGVRGFIEAMLEEELADVLLRPRYGRRQAAGDEPQLATGYRHGHRERTLIGTFGTTRIAVPRARLADEDGATREWRSQSLHAYQRRTKAAEALIAGVYLAGTNTRRVRRALGAMFEGAVGKDVVSRTWRKVKVDWEAWCARSLAEEPIVRLILDGTVVSVRLDRKATSISLLVALGVRADGQKVLLAIRNMGGESEAAWRAFLDDLVARGLSAGLRHRRRRRGPGDGARRRSGRTCPSSAAPSTSTATCWPTRRIGCTTRSPDDYNDMIYAETKERSRRSARPSCANGG